MRKLLILAAALILAAPLAQARSLTEAARDATDHAWTMALGAGADARPCRDVIGLEEARALARYCIMHSAATHPPCNSHNACSMLVDELRRSCHETRSGPLPCAAGMSEQDWRDVARFRAN
jgi:hypothetical protein